MFESSSSSSSSSYPPPLLIKIRLLDFLIRVLLLLLFFFFLLYFLPLALVSLEDYECDTNSSLSETLSSSEILLLLLYDIAFPFFVCLLILRLDD